MDSSIDYRIESATISHHTVDQLFEIILPLCAEYEILILDLGKVRYLDSTGLAFLMTLHRQMVLKSGKLIISNYNASVQMVFTHTKMDSVLNVETAQV